jgi:hypothetical protein
MGTEHRTPIMGIIRRSLEDDARVGWSGERPTIDE